MAQQTFEEIVDAVMQAESRGKRYKDDGKTLTTSAKGALGEMQVMPKTSRDPGFGVVPAKDKSPDEIARVGKDYLQAMLGKYGDTEKALIAYNWGPGVTDKWLAAGANPDKLPAETRTYVQRVKGFLGGKDVPRETSVAKKEREPLPPSLPPMAQAPTIKPEAAARVASLGPGYQAALALSFLAETDDEEDRKTTITQEYLAKAQEEEDDIAASAAIAKRQANVFADLSNTTIRSPFAQPQQPVMMANGGQVNLPMYDADGNRYVIGGGGDPVTNPFSNLTPAQQAAFYATSPALGAATRGLQTIFNATTFGKFQNAVMPGFQAQQNVVTHGFVPSDFVDPGLAVAADAEAAAAAANAAAAAGGPAAGAADGNTGGGPGTGAPGDAAFAYGGMVRRANGSPEGGEVSAEDLTKPSFGNPNIRKQGEAARRLAAMRDVNTLPDPKTYAAVAGALGTRPDQMGFSVLNPKYKEIMDVANPAFYAGTALQIAPVAQGPGMGRMVGAAERALEPAVRRTLEGGGKASEMLQALAAPPSQMFVRARPEAAARHADLQAQGLSPEQIRAQNLTLVDNRGNLLEEISDAPAVLQQKTASVPRMYYDMLKHPELQSIYPAYDMPDVRIGTTRRKDAPLAAASFGEKEGIQGTVRSLPGDDVRGTVRGTLLHEGQHAIQSMEGFTEGANPSSFVAYIKAKRGLYDADPTVNENVIREMERVYPNLSDITDRIGQDLKARYGKVFPSDKRMGEALYRHMPGEVQAELARVRSNLTPDELKATPLEVSMQQLNINPANILEMNKMGSRLDRQIGDLEYDVYGYAQGGPVYRAEGSPKEGERKLDRETMDMLRRQGTSPASLQRVAPPVDIGSSAAGLPGLMLFADPRIDQTNAYGYMLDGGNDTKNRAMAQAMFLNKSRAEDYPDTIAHETEHLLARQNLGSAANINSKFDELIGNKGTSRFNFVRDAVKAAPYLKEKYDLQSSYLDPKMLEYQSKFGLGKNLLYEQLASLAALEQRHKIDLTKDPELRKTLFSRPDVRETYNALTGLRQTRLDPRDLPPYTRVAEPGMLDAIKGVFKRAEGGPVYRAEGSPEEGEVAPRLTMQQIERLAAQEAAEREAASTPAFIAQKSGIGRKAGNISNALNTGTAYPAIAAGAMDVPYDLAGLPVDLTTMAMRPFGYSEQKPVFGSEYFKDMATEAGIRRPTPTDPTLKGFHTFGQVGAGLLAPGKIIQGAQALKGAAAEALAGFRAGRAEKPGMRDLMTGQRVEAPILTPQQQAEQRTVAALFDNLAGANQQQIAADVAAGRLPAYVAPQLTAAEIQAQNIARLPQDAQEQLRLFEEAAARPRPVAIRRQGPAPEIVQPPPTTAVAITQPATKLPPPPPFVAPPVSAEFPFVGRLDEFAAGMTGPAQKEQLINQVKGKFREQDVARLEDALAGLGPKDKVTPAMLQNALANTYPPSRYRSVEIPATSPMYQDVDNVFSQDKPIAGSMNLYLKESPESEALFDSYLAVKKAAQKAFSSNNPEEINLALDSLKNNPLSLQVPEINVMIDRIEEALPTITRFGKLRDELGHTETMILYPLLYKENGFSFFPEANRRAQLIGQGMDPVQYNRTKYDILNQEESKLIKELMQKGSDRLVALGGNPVDVNAFAQRHANNPSFYNAAGTDDIIKEHIKNNVTPINDGINAAITRAKENIYKVYSTVDDKLQPYTGYAGRHRAVTGGDNMPIGFSRYTEHAIDIDGKQLKGRHVHELQSDLSKDIKNLGPKGRSLEKDQKELDSVALRYNELSKQISDNISKGIKDPALAAENAKLEQRKNVLEDRILGPRSREAPYERDINKRKSIYVLEEPFANFETSPAVEMQLLIKNAIQSSIRAGQDFVTFPGKESKQAQLYEKLLPNLKQAVKDLGGEKAGFEIKPITLPNPTGDSPTVYGVIWSPETAAKAIEKGVPFNKGGMVERKADDNRKYM